MRFLRISVAVLALSITSVVWGAGAASAVPGTDGAAGSGAKPAPAPLAKMAAPGQTPPASTCSFTRGSRISEHTGASAYNGVTGCGLDSGKATFVNIDRSAQRTLMAFYTSGGSAVGSVYIRPDGRVAAYFGGGCGEFNGHSNAATTFTVSWEKRPAPSNVYDITVSSAGATSSLGCQNGEVGEIRLGGETTSGEDGCSCTATLVEAGGLEVVDPPEPVDCGVLPALICEGVGAIGNIAAPIVAAIGSLASTLVGAIGSLGSTIVAALEALASRIWEEFQRLVIDPEEVGPAIAEKAAQFMEGNLGSWVDGIEEIVSSVIPTVETGSIEGLCVDPDGDVCIGEQLSNMPSAADTFMTMAMYAWCAITYVYLVGATVKTVRR